MVCQLVRTVAEGREIGPRGCLSRILIYSYSSSHYFAFVGLPVSSSLFSQVAEHTSDGAQRDTNDDLPHFPPRLLTSPRAHPPTNNNKNQETQGEHEGATNSDSSNVSGSPAAQLSAALRLPQL